MSEKKRQLTPKTRYLGSKRKLLNWIRPTLDELNFSTAVDLMSGTSSVAYLLKSMGKQVVANDILTFNSITAKALIENSLYHVDEEDTQWILQTNSDVKYTNFIESTFEGMYFTAEENSWIDQTICNINQLKRGGSRAVKFKQALATHALIQACLMKRPFNLFHRRNLNLRQAKVTRSFGNCTTWETSFNELFVRHIRESNSFVFDNGCINLATNEDAIDLSRQSVDLVYMDPPYFQMGNRRRQSDYRFNYHFVEGLAQYEKWPELVDPDSPLGSLKSNGGSSEILYRCKCTDLQDELISWFKKIIENWPNAQWVMSYKQPGIPDVESICKLFQDTGRIVKVRQTEYSYVLNKRNGEPNENLELLFIAN